MDLRANTAVDVLIGPFVDKTDGNTTEDALTLTAAEIKLSKNGQALTLKTDVTAAAFDDDGYYNCELDVTDTDTEGNLVLIVHQSANALPVRHEYNVLSEAAYDSLYAAKDAGFMDVNIKTVGRVDTQETEADNLESACANYSATRGLTGTAVPAAAADGAFGLPISDAGGLDMDAEFAEIPKVLASGTAQAGGTSTQIILAASSAFADNILQGAGVEIISGTGAGQSRVIKANVLTGDVCTVANVWTTNPDATSVYQLTRANVNVAAWGWEGAQLSAEGGETTLPFVAANVRQMDNASIGGTGSQIAAAFIKLFNVTSPTGTVNSLPDAVPDAAGGLPISDAGGLDLDAEFANAVALMDRNAFLIESARSGHTWQGNYFYVDPVNGNDSTGDGSRLLPYATIQAAHDDLVTTRNHDVIFLVAGHATLVTTHTIAGTTTISKDYVSIRGPGRDFIITRTGAGDTLAFTGDGVDISGVQIGTAATGSGDGISITDADFCKVEHCWILDTRGDGINILRGSNCIITENVFAGTGVGGSGQGIHIVGTAGVSSDNVIDSNIFKETAGDSILIENGTTNDTFITRNLIHDSSGWAINIGASSTDAIVHGNIFGNNSSGNITDAGTTTIEHHNRDWLSATVEGRTLGVETDGDLTKVNVLDGHTPQTADHTAGIAAIPTAVQNRSEMDSNSTELAKIGTVPNLGGGATLGQNNSDMAGLTFSAGNDDLENIHDDIAAVKAETVLILADTADMQPKLGTPAVDVSADIAAVKVDTAATLTDTGTTIPALLPSALVGGRIDASMSAIAGVQQSATNLERSASTIIIGTATGVPTTTTMAATGLTGATDDEHYVGREIIWTSGVLIGQAATITGYVVATDLFTFAAVTTAPSAGNGFVII